MSQVAISGNASGTGTLTIAAPNTNSNYTLTLPTGTGAFNISGVVNEVPAGTVSAPSIYPTGDTNTGIFFPAADTVGVSTGGSERMRINSSGNLLVGTTSGGNNARLKSKVTANTYGLEVTDEAQSDFIVAPLSGGVCRVGPSAGAMAFYASNTECARIDSSGNLLVGVTATINGLNASGHFKNVNAGAAGIVVGNAGGTSTTNTILFTNSNGTVGGISTSGSATSFNTSSDYRLKNTIAPMTGALAKVALLKPCTYKWNVDGSDGEGFIAHELAEICPHAVNGEKDAVETYTDEDGNEATRPIYQGIDTSFLVATLTAAIQEQQALIQQLQADVAALKGATP